MEVQSNYYHCVRFDQRRSVISPRDNVHYLQPLCTEKETNLVAAPAISPSHFYPTTTSVAVVKMECLGTPPPNLSSHNDQTMLGIRAIKNEYQDQPVKTSDIKSSAGNGNSQTEVGQMDLYRDLILCHLIQDITNTCAKLCLPTELSAWSAVDCDKWIQEMCGQFQLATDPKTSRRLNGSQLLALGAEEFIELFPNGGDTLHAQLQLWKTAFESFSLKERFVQSGRCQGQVQPSDQRMLTIHPNNDWSSVQGNWSKTAQMVPSSVSDHQMHSSTSESTHFQNSVHQRHQQMTMTSNCNSAFDSSDLCSNISPSSSATNTHDESLTDDDLYFYSSTPSASGNDAPNGSSLFYQNKTDDATFYGNQIAMQQQHQIRHMGQAPPTMRFYAQHQQQLPPPNHQQQDHQRQQFTVQQPSLALTTVPSRPLSPPIIKGTGHTGTGTIHLWHFIRELLEQPKEYGGCIRWVDRKEGTFKIESSHHLARYWGMRKNRSQMNYDKLSRSLRQYYKKGIIQKPEKKQRLVYKFLPPYNQ